MALVSQSRSSLNPNAAPFIPLVYRQVEDFSPEWWDLVKTMPWFRDFWLSQQLHEEKEEEEEYLTLVNEFDFGDDGEEFFMESEIKEKKGLEVKTKDLLIDLNVSKSPKEKGSKYSSGSSKFLMKPNKCVSPKFNPRRIQQPR
ncbi:hypothetical protein ACFE04_000339 [Oxalis oulophora]